MKVNEPKLEDIPVIHEFHGVFLKDLLGLPPSREVEFARRLFDSWSYACLQNHFFVIATYGNASNFLTKLKETPDKACRSGYHQFEEYARRRYSSKTAFQDEGTDIFEFYASCLSYKEEHEVNLKLILELFKKEKLFGKFSKCEVWLQEGDEQGNAFQTLKDMLCDASILAFPKGTDDFVVYQGRYVLSKCKDYYLLQNKVVLFYTDHKCLFSISSIKNNYYMRQRMMDRTFSRDLQRAEISATIQLAEIPGMEMVEISNGSS
ncbi:hypothetical protein Tco_0939635 [Tanacetum coccineum]|uniref:Reverse transcriptase RNase H-like domain-containing protein n=1 Tax=Tanacetum coccineum TaxID=301880 RepID=A0ABQ5DKN1_9ASTR